ncbi:hypothetical protein M885DRAFT_538458, partial [Pelagophyceae sp. CCMP2097]
MRPLSNEPCWFARILIRSADAMMTSLTSPHSVMRRSVGRRPSCVSGSGDSVSSSRAHASSSSWPTPTPPTPAPTPPTPPTPAPAAPSTGAPAASTGALAASTGARPASTGALASALASMGAASSVLETPIHSPRGRSRSMFSSDLAIASKSSSLAVKPAAPSAMEAARRPPKETFGRFTLETSTRLRSSPPSSVKSHVAVFVWSFGPVFGVVAKCFTLRFSS